MRADSRRDKAVQPGFWEAYVKHFSTTTTTTTTTNVKRTKPTSSLTLACFFDVLTTTTTMNESNREDTAMGGNSAEGLGGTADGSSRRARRPTTASGGGLGNHRRGMTSTGSATSSVTTTTSMKRRPSSNSLDDVDDDQEADGEGGYVASRYRTPNSSRQIGGRKVDTGATSSSTSTTNTNNSSWAQDDTRRLRSQYSILRYPDPAAMTTDDKTTSQRQHQQRRQVILDDLPIPPQPPYNKHDDGKSFRGWLAGSMFGALNAAAGITLSATGKVASPALGITQNVILPSVLEWIVDTLDVVTPPFIKDWFRIISSSVYHLYSVLASTNQGKVVRKQLLLVVQSILETWSAPESRQVVVDGMAAGIKLADALHTPEMLAFLEQTSVLGCRVVDALSSGKAKQLIHNSKDLVWNGIELVVDPATTVALAEITAHLCHALEETADSITYLESKGGGNGIPRRTASGLTPRPRRDSQNKATYVYPNQVTDYQAECIENVILSSLGVEVNTNRTLENERGMTRGRTDEKTAQKVDIDDDTVTTDRRSVASNEDFSATMNKSKEGQQNPLWISREDSVNVDLLRDRILQGGRPRTRPSMQLSGQSITKLHDSNIDHPSNQQSNSLTDLQSKKQVEDELRKLLDVEEVPIKDRRDGPVPHRHTTNYSKTYIRDVNDKLEAFGTALIDNTNELSGAAQFYQLVDAYMQKERQKNSSSSEDVTIPPSDFPIDEGLDKARTKLLQARVRKLKEGKVQRERSRKTREQHSKSRRTWQYPPVVAKIVILLVASTILFWTVFGLYGLYTVSQVAYYQGVSVRNFLFPTKIHPDRQQRRSSGATNSVDSGSSTSNNEMVIRIIREVVHVREDGSIIDGQDGSMLGSSSGATASFTKEEMESVMECVASMEEKSSSSSSSINMKDIKKQQTTSKKKK